MDARREAQRISRISASRATTQTRFLAATRRDGTLLAHFCVARPLRIAHTPSGSRLELRPKRLRRIRESRSGRLQLQLLPRQAFFAPTRAHAAVMLFVERPFEAVEHVVDLGEAGLLERESRVDRAVAAAADEDHRPVHARDLLDL